jgi:hypothetical protein
MLRDEAHYSLIPFSGVTAPNYGVGYLGYKFLLRDLRCYT